uniref:Uncharacterized protein n=1 Tax=Lepeophtheirus salmonis TaxID=72036 RepID=A0A0K2UTY8_LEPSM
MALTSTIYFFLIIGHGFRFKWFNRNNSEMGSLQGIECSIINCSII